jgi:hypothetical protein
MQKTYRLAVPVIPIMAHPICIDFFWSLDLSVEYWILKYMHTDTLFIQNNYMAIQKAHSKKLHLKHLDIHGTLPYIVDEC